ncbi:hypothetical protein QOZ80_1BG0078180 [Eleusine coracana subsp. coracana]|nr:hypothetical protein QOZ80_1BG0078180 [Eleusine coracana subsp. coracana]
MPPSKPKRRRGGASSRGRKKHKRLDAIHDVTRAPPPPFPGGIGGGGEDSDAEARRRSTRVRRAPVLLDTSPLPSPRHKRPRGGGGGFGSSGASRRRSKGRSRDEVDGREMEGEEDEDDDGGNVVWRSRLRDRVKGKAKLGSRARSLYFGEEDYEYRDEEGEEEGDDDDEEEEEEAGMVVVDVREGAEDEEAGAEDEEAGEEIGGFGSQGRELRDREINLTIDLNVESHGSVEGVNVIGAEEGESGARAEEKAVAEEEEEEEEPPVVGMRNDLEGGKVEETVEEHGLQQEEKAEELEFPLPGGGNNGDELACDQGNEDVGARNSGGIERLGVQKEQFAEESDLAIEQQMEVDRPGPVEQEEDAQRGEKMDHDPDVVLARDGPKEKIRKSPVSDEKLGVKVVKEGRRCGLCGGGTDGKPPKIALHDAVDSDNEAYEGALPSEEPNYDMWDGFGDDPGWLGRLLGPIHDRFGIARVWVHQNCAVWSPEVYFAGLGCLRNVRAALCRGRLLKCSRCGRPGATIGCRVDRCPKTYHLPCSRAEACVFDHRKFLIACNDHRHLFQPQGDKYIELIRKMKIKKMKADIRKLSHDAWRKDREAEERWLENCGEDEEFLKREGKRLNRDLLRIAPVYIGGSAENEKSYQGLAPPRGILLHGHPGTGKTLVEGNGDILTGLTQILLKCVNLGRCIIYMPRIDLWAVEKVQSQIQENMLNTEPSNLASSSTKHIKKCSEVWNVLVEQMDSLLASVSISVLSTSDLRFQDLPSGVRGFFSAHVVDQCISSSEHTIPRFALNIDSCFSWDEMIDSCVLRLSHDLIQHHVQFLHERSHKNNDDEQKEVFASMEISAPGESKASGNEQPPGVGSRENLTQLAPSSSLQESAPNVKDRDENVQKIGFEDTIQRNPSNRVVKGNESLAIMSFGIQILQHPQFSKLCWVTSKLQEGPCTDINGPWKGWPFNSCLLHSTTSSDNDKLLNVGSNVVKGKEKTLCVRGLVAIGLLAYRGFYSSVIEVCADVRKVLELLVGQIQTKFLEKRNRFRYFHILSQVAYLDDIVNSWAYTFQRFHIDNTTRTSSTKISNQGRSCPDECQSTNASVQIDPSGNPTVAQDIPAQNTMDHEAVPTRPDEMQDNSVRRSPDRFEIHTMACDPGDDHVTSIAGRDAAGHNFVHSVPPAMNRGNSTQFDTTNEKTNGANNDEKILESTSYEENCRSDIQIYENTESIEHLNDLQRAENSVTSADNTEISRNNVSAEAHVENNELKTNNPLDDLVSGHLINGYLQDNTKNPSLPTSPCLYKCCSACFRAVYKMVHDNLSNSLSPNHCLTVDDMHDILSSWSLNLLSTVRKYYSTQDMVNCEENFGKMQNQETRLEHCACHVDVTLLPRECICHMEGNDNDEATSTNPHSLFGQRLNYFFKDGIWMPSDDTSETTLHCSFKRLCVCSVLGTISMFSQSPVDDIV